MFSQIKEYGRVFSVQEGAKKKSEWNKMSECMKGREKKLGSEAGKLDGRGMSTEMVGPRRRKKEKREKERCEFGKRTLA